MASDPAPPLPLLGVIGGSNLLRSTLFEAYAAAVVETRFGPCSVMLPPGVRVLGQASATGAAASTSTGAGGVRLHWPDDSRRLVFIQRHSANPEKAYTPPHLINKRAVVEALACLGCDRVLSFASVGTLRVDIPVGMVVLADDFFHFPGAALSCFDDDRSHFVPHLTPSTLRDQICTLLDAKSISYRGGTYAQANGPRFETKAEIRFLSTVADVVGMTAAEEVGLILERQLQCALFCVVDNAANGVVIDESVTARQLTIVDFHSGVKSNQTAVDSMVTYILESLTGSASPSPT